MEVVPGEDVASDAGGTLYIVKQHSVEKMIGGTSTVIAGAGTFAAFGDGGPAAAARLDGPVALALQASGEIDIAEQAANRIRKVAANGTISILVSDPAQAVGTSGIAVDGAGSIFFTDTSNNRVRRIGAGGVLSTVIDKLGGPTCVRTGPDGSLYVCDRANDRIVRITTSGAVTIVANVSKPSGIAVAADGTLYSSSGSQVLLIAPSGMSTVLADGLNGPAGLALDSAGGLLIAESGNHRVLKLGAAGAVTVIAGSGQAGFGGDGGAAGLALLNNPEDVAVDAMGNILIADSGNNRIRKLTATAAPLLTAPVVTPPPTLTMSPLTVVNAASQLAGSIVANQIITIYGAGFDPAHTQVTFDGQTATVFYAGPLQLNVLVPPAMKPLIGTTLTVLANGVPVGTMVLNTTSSAPGIFTVSNGIGQAAALNEDLSVNSDKNPASRGSIIVLFMTGDGGAPMTVKIGDYAADVLYAGPAPGFPGLTQVNARIPAGFAPAGTLQVVATAGGVSSQAAVTIVVR